MPGVRTTKGVSVDAAQRRHQAFRLCRYPLVASSVSTSLCSRSLSARSVLCALRPTLPGSRRVRPRLEMRRAMFSTSWVASAGGGETRPVGARERRHIIVRFGRLGL